MRIERGGGRQIDLRPWFVVLAVSVILVVAMTADLLAHGVLFRFDWTARKLSLETRIPWLKQPVTLLVMMGQRAYTVPVALIATGLMARRLRTWYPVGLMLVTLFAHNVVVGAAKYGLGRAKAESGSGDFFAGGNIYPSGHTSNTVITYGVIVYLVVNYGLLRCSRRLLAIAALPTLIVSFGSLFINSHWVSDIVAGWLFGAIILCGMVIIDQHYVQGTPWSRRHRPVVVDAREPAAAPPPVRISSQS